jgi:hypothetical protein
MTGNRKQAIRTVLLLAFLLGGGLLLHWVILPGRGSGRTGTHPGRGTGSRQDDLPTPTLVTNPFKGLATLVQLEHDVKSRRASELVWEQAVEEMELFEDDAVRTHEQSTAFISFGRDGILQVEEKSLVVIKPPRQKERSNQITLAHLSGSFLENLNSKSPKDRDEAIREASEQRHLTLEPLGRKHRPGRGTEAAIRLLSDDSTGLQVLTGAMKVVGPTGDEIILKENMVAKIGSDGRLTRPRPLPAAPDLLRPAQEATFTFQSRTPRVELQWGEVPGVDTYRILVSHDRGFRRIFAEDRVKGTTLELRNLRPGKYFWRVRGVDTDAFEGPFSTARTLFAVFDDEPPRLEILSPPELFTASDPTVQLQGTTDAEVRLKVNGETVGVESNGTFTHLLRLQQGINLVTIEATDPAGNSSYQRRLITFKGARKSAVSQAVDS